MDTLEEMQDRQQQECPQCHSANVVRLFDGKTRSLICDDCGHNWESLICNVEMPLAKNPHPIHYPKEGEAYTMASPMTQTTKDELIHDAFEEGTKTQRQLAIDSGWRPVPSKEWLKLFIFKETALSEKTSEALAQALYDMLKGEL